MPLYLWFNLKAVASCGCLRGWSWSSILHAWKRMYFPDRYPLLKSDALDVFWIRPELFFFFFVLFSCRQCCVSYFWNFDIKFTPSFLWDFSTVNFQFTFTFPWLFTLGNILKYQCSFSLLQWFWLCIYSITVKYLQITAKWCLIRD